MDWQAMLDRPETSIVTPPERCAQLEPYLAERGAMLLQIDDLTLQLPPGADRTFATEGVSLAVMPGEIVCIVGESGSGKSMTASAVMRLLPLGASIARGSIRLDGRDLATLPEAAMR